MNTSDNNNDDINYDDLSSMTVKIPCLFCCRN